MWCFARFGTICTILKAWKNTHGGVLLHITGCQIIVIIFYLVVGVTSRVEIVGEPIKNEFECGNQWRTSLNGKNHLEGVGWIFLTLCGTIWGGANCFQKKDGGKCHWRTLWLLVIPLVWNKILVKLNKDNKLNFFKYNQKDVVWTIWFASCYFCFSYSLFTALLLLWI